MRSIRDFQLSLFGGVNASQIVNVASVSQRSPFRYPGGKTWLVPFVIQWLIHQPKRPAEFIEPFAGGAIIGLTVAFEQLANHVTLVELDKEVAAVWKTIIYGNYEWLADQVIHFDLTPENVDRELSKTDVSVEEKAFQTILRNRINRGGILAPGAGRIKNGENGKGIKSRWYPETLRKRILSIGKIRDRITFIEGDGLKFLGQNASRPDVVYFIDPPYTAAGKKAGARLYTHFEIDHERLFAIAETLQGDFLMTYDNALGVKQMAEQHGFVTDLVAMKNTHHTEMMELLISRSLEWLYG
ncbi:MAG: DNA adenine methylase [Anaerolineales bacterium]|nr:DNA adenine methylase [Anaerolineales bacterium]